MNIRCGDKGRGDAPAGHAILAKRRNDAPVGQVREILAIPNFMGPTSLIKRRSVFHEDSDVQNSGNGKGISLRA